MIKGYMKINATSIIKKYQKDNNIYEDNQIVTEIFDKYKIPEKYRAILLGIYFNKTFNYLHINEIFTNKELFVNSVSKDDRGVSILNANFKNDILTFVHGEYEEYNKEKFKNFLIGLMHNHLEADYYEAVKEIMQNKLEIKKPSLGNILKKKLKHN